jgi:hypothetical protein
MEKITSDMVERWEIDSLADAIGNCLELNNDFLSRYCGKDIAEQLSRVPESEREYILQSHIGEGYSVHTIPTESDREIMLPIGEIEYQFEGQPEDVFENPDDFYISGDCAYISCYGVYFPVDVDSLKSEIDEILSGQVIDDIFDDFFSGYLRAAIFTGSHYPDPDNMDDSRPMDSVYTLEDIPREIWAELESDCRDFLNHSGFMVAENPKTAGMDFHFTRNGHGAGFWDGDWPEFGAELTARSRPYGTAEIYSDPAGIYLHH